MLKYHVIWACSDTKYSGLKRALSINIFVVSFTNSIVYLDARYFLANLSLST